MASEYETRHNARMLNSEALVFLLSGEKIQFNSLRDDNRAWQPEFSDRTLAGCDLEDLDLHGCRFTDIHFGEVNGQCTNFSGSVFTRCRFDRANLEGATFRGATIISSSFMRATLVDTDMEAARLLLTNILEPVLTTPDGGSARNYSLNLRRAIITGGRLSHDLFTDTLWLDYADFRHYTREKEDDTSEDLKELPFRPYQTCVTYGKDRRYCIGSFLEQSRFRTQELVTEIEHLVRVFEQASWNTVIYEGELRRRADLLPDSHSPQQPSSTEPKHSPPPSSMLQEMQDGAIRAASAELTLACRDLAVQGVARLPIADELRVKFVAFLKTKSGEHLIAALLSLMLQTGITDHLPLIPEDVKKLLRERLPRELRVGAMQEIFKELSRFLLTTAASAIARLQEAAVAVPEPPPPEPAQLPEPGVRPFDSPARTRIRKTPVGRRRKSS